MIQPQIIDHWTVRDVLLHITAWESELLRWLERATHGHSPDIPAPGEWSEYTDQFNNRVYLENRDQPLKDVLLSFNPVFNRVLSELQALPGDPGDTYWLVWLGGRPPWELLATCHEHYREHSQQINDRLVEEKQG